MVLYKELMSMLIFFSLKRELKRKFHRSGMCFTSFRIRRFLSLITVSEATCWKNIWHYSRLYDLGRQIPTGCLGAPETSKIPTKTAHQQKYL